MKKFTSVTFQLLLNGLLAFIAVKLLKYLLIPAVITTLVMSFFRTKVGEGFLNVSQYLREVAVSVDQLGNVVCSDLFDVTLIKRKQGYRFGNPDETISGVLGKNQRLNTLSKVGKALNFILNKLDPNHSIKSIEDDETV